MDFWISLTFTKVSDSYREPKGVYLSDFRGSPAITVFRGVAQGSAGASYYSSDISDREYSIILKFLTQTDGLWFTPHLERFRSTGDVDLTQTRTDFYNHFGFPLLPYSSSSFPREFKLRSNIEDAEQDAAANP